MNNTDDDYGPPMPDFRGASGIQLQTIGPAVGLPMQRQPDYLDYDPKGRGIMTTCFANSGMAYLLGTTAGGAYGLRHGLINTPSTRFRVRLNSVLNQCGRYGSKCGNTSGVFAVFYSLYEGIADHYEFESMLGLRYTHYPAISSFVSPAFGMTATCSTYFAPSGVRVAALAGATGFGTVTAVYGLYTVLGIPYGSLGFLFF